MNKKSKWSFYMKFFPFLIMVVVIFMSVGYATVNGVNLNISGSALGGILPQNDIYISDYTGSDSVVFNNVGKLYVDSSVTLDNDSYSTKTITLTITNPTSVSYTLNDVYYAEDLVDTDPNVYSNNDIIFSYSASSLTINANSSITLTITFSYRNNTVSIDRTLRSILNIDVGSSLVITNSIKNEELTFTDVGRSSEGVIFDGLKSYGTYKNNNGFPITYSFTFKTNSVNGMLFAEPKNGTGLGFMGNKIILNSGSSSTYSTYEYEMDSPLELDTWYTLHVLYSSRTSHSVYLNTTQLSIGNTQNYWQVSLAGNNGVVGGVPSSSTYANATYFNGVIKRYLIYRGVINQSAITQNFNAIESGDVYTNSLIMRFEMAE